MPHFFLLPPQLTRSRKGHKIGDPNLGEKLKKKPWQTTWGFWHVGGFGVSGAWCVALGTLFRSWRPGPGVSLDNGEAGGTLCSTSLVPLTLPYRNHLRVSPPLDAHLLLVPEDAGRLGSMQRACGGMCPRCVGPVGADTTPFSPDALCPPGSGAPSETRLGNSLAS